jgi:DNA-directed RNA polymerase-3 subunit RPC5
MVTGVVQMRPQFHHLDAKGQLARAKQTRERAANEREKPSESKLITQRAVMAEDEEMNIKQTEDFLDKAAREHWTKLKYHDEDSEEAYNAYGNALFVKETTNSEQLVSPWNNDQFLDAISIPRIETGARNKKKPPLTRKQMADMRKEAEDDEAAEEALKEAEQAAAV